MDLSKALMCFEHILPFSSSCTLPVVNILHKGNLNSPRLISLHMIANLSVLLNPTFPLATLLCVSVSVICVCACVCLPHKICLVLINDIINLL